MIRKPLTAVLVASGFLALVLARVLYEARSEYLQGDRWLARGDSEEAIVHYRRAAHWYAPVNPWMTAALDRLSSIGQRAERHQQIDIALAAYRGIRGSILAARSFYTPMPSRLARANRRIAALMALQPRPAQDVGKTAATLAREHLVLLEKDDSPSVLWSIVLLAGFFTWVGAGFGLIYRGLDTEGRLLRATAGRWAGLIVLGTAAWIIGMVLA